MGVTIVDELPTTGKFLKFRKDQLYQVRKIFGVEKPERLKESVQMLKDWLQKQDHFNKKDFSDGYLERLLISAKGSVERSKSRHDQLCTLRTIWPQYFTAVDINSFRKDFVTFNSIVLPEVTEEYARVNIFKLNSNVPLQPDLILTYIKYSIIGITKIKVIISRSYSISCSDWERVKEKLLAYSEEKSRPLIPDQIKQVNGFYRVCEYAKVYDYSNGFIILLDYQDVNLLDLLTILSPSQLQQMLNLYTEGYGMRIQGIHLITTSKVSDALISLLKQVLSKKVASRIHVHRSHESLYDFIPKKILPAEYGGDAPSVSNMTDDFMKALSSKEHMEHMQEIQKATVDLSKKPKDSADELIGMSGSFRTLSVD